jgi:hypothetical protein
VTHLALQSLAGCTLCDVAIGIKTILSLGVHLTGELPSLRERPNFLLNGWLSEVERDILPLNLMRTTVRTYFAAATISRSSTSNTNVAPGLIVGGAPLSP